MSLAGRQDVETLAQATQSMSYIIYLCVFRVSDCCEATINRIVQGGSADVFVCTHCWDLCNPVEDPR